MAMKNTKSTALTTQTYILVQHGAKTQFVEENSTAPFTKKEITWKQEIVRTLLYYFQAVDPTLAATLSTITSQQATTTVKTEQACHQLLDYVPTHPNAAVHFLASDMILTVHSDAFYMVSQMAPYHVCPGGQWCWGKKKGQYSWWTPNKCTKQPL